MNADQNRLYRELFEQYGPLVYRRARGILGNHADAEEATQEVFVRVILKYDTFRRESATTTWLYRVTTNQCLMMIRDRKRRGALLDANAEAVAPNHPAMVSQTSMVLLRQLLGEADPKQAKAAVCVYVDGMTLDQAAEQMDVSRRSVTNLLQRFRAWARKRAAR